MTTFNYYYYYDNLGYVKSLDDLKYFISFEDKGDYEYSYKELLYLSDHPEILKDDYPFLLESERKEVLKDVDYFLTKVEEEIKDEEGLFNSKSGDTVFSSDVRIQNDSSSTQEPHTEGESKNEAIYKAKSSLNQKGGS